MHLRAILPFLIMGVWGGGGYGGGANLLFTFRNYHTLLKKALLLEAK